LKKAEKKLDIFFDSLKQTPKGAFFNPWFQHDRENDKNKEAFKIRRRQLRCYLKERLKTARYLFIAEALGYQGGHFTGIAMTSERILLGHHMNKYSIHPTSVIKSIKPQRTSKDAVIKKGFTEPTATIVWKALGNLNINPYETVLWNALCWHPYDKNKGLLSNRTPTRTEMESGRNNLICFRSLFQDCKVLAIGRKAELALSGLGIEHTGLRHPANGGAPKFRRQLRSIMK